MRGIYQQCSHKHLQRYVNEFNFRYNNRVALNYNDSDRADVLLQRHHRQVPHLSNNWFGLMPKKKATESQKEQSTRLRAEVERMIEAGALSPTETDKAMYRLVHNSGLNQSYD